jgi:hypothetical protein
MYLAIKGRVPRLTFPLLLLVAGLTVSVSPARADGEAGFMDRRFYYHDFSGRPTSARIIRHYWRPVVHPLARIDPRINPKLVRAATIAEERANARSHGLCWRYVKTALLASGALKSYPTTAYAAEAGTELVNSYGFVRLSINDPYAAPVGSVLVYGYGSHGHVEIRARDGFVSDYHSKNRCFYPLRAVYAKLSS